MLHSTFIVPPYFGLEEVFAPVGAVEAGAAADGVPDPEAEHPQMAATHTSKNKRTSNFFIFSPLFNLFPTRVLFSSGNIFY
jgi:hypothetical protein